MKLINMCSVKDGQDIETFQERCKILTPDHYDRFPVCSLLFIYSFIYLFIHLLIHLLTNPKKFTTKVSAGYPLFRNCTEI